MSSRYILYTVGTKGDNFFLGECFANQEASKRKKSKNKDSLIQKLEYLPSYDDKQDVIQVTFQKEVYLNNQLKRFYMISCYVIQDNECYSSGIFTRNGYRGSKSSWEKCPEKKESVKAWIMEFKRMYPGLQREKDNTGNNKNVLPIENIFKLRQEAREWIDFILNTAGFRILEAGIEVFTLKQPFVSIVRLVYAEDCYLNGNIEEGDKYFSRVYFTKDCYSIVAEEFVRVLKVRNEKIGEEGKAIFLPREGIKNRVKPIVRKDSQYYEDLIYELRKATDLDFIFNEETEARISKRCGDYEMFHLDEEDLTEFENEFFMLVKKIMKNATGEVKKYNIRDYPKEVKREILRLEAEIELLQIKELSRGRCLARFK